MILLDDSDPLVICVAPNGARKNRNDHPDLPITPEQLAATASQCRAAGATVLHLHVRDRLGDHSLDPGHYREAFREIELVAPGLLIQATSESAGRYKAEDQEEAILALRPRAASVAIREIIPEGRDAAGARFYARARDANIALQHITYSVEDVERLIQLRDAGIIRDERLHVLFVLGRYATSGPSHPAEILPLLDRWQNAGPWSVCAFGVTEPRCLALAVALGGHVRVGFENNLLAPDGTVAVNNAANVLNAADLARATGRAIAVAAIAERIYGVMPAS